MKKIENKKKNWEKPTVTALSIKKETASGNRKDTRERKGGITGNKELTYMS